MPTTFLFPSNMKSLPLSFSLINNHSFPSVSNKQSTTKGTILLRAQSAATCPKAAVSPRFLPQIRAPAAGIARPFPRFAVTRVPRGCSGTDSAQEPRNSEGTAVPRGSSGTDGSNFPRGREGTERASGVRGRLDSRGDCSRGRVEWRR